MKRKRSVYYSKKCEHCGKEFNNLSLKYGVAKSTWKNMKYCSRECYLKGHVVWSKGKTGVFSEEVLEKISRRTKEGMKKVPYKTLAYWKGKKLSPEHVENLKGHESWSKGLTKETDERVKRISRALKGKKHSKETKKKISLDNINNPRKVFCGTKIELKMREELERRGLKKDKDFFCNIGVENIANVDIFIPSQKIIIECDGCYYHGCPKHFPDKFKNIQKKDKEKTLKLTKAGFKVFRFWEHQIHSSPKKCVDSIRFQ